MGTSAPQASTRLTLTTYETDPSGNQVAKEQQVDILIFDNSQEVNTLIS
jgi:hypothetical protein